MTSHNNFQNEIDRPVKNVGDYTRISTSMTIPIDSSGLLNIKKIDVNLLSGLDVWNDVSPRWERHLWPLLWRVLLTNSQLDEQGALIKERLHGSIVLGMMALGYSQQDDFWHQYAVAPRVKYRFSERFWGEGLMEYTPRFSKDVDYHTTDVTLKAGCQLDQGFSFEGGVGYYYLYRDDASRDEWHSPESDEAYGLGTIRYRIFSHHEIIFQYQHSYTRYRLDEKSRLEQNMIFHYSYIF
ncbi:MAG: hypothetical protein OCD01_02065 [Fibrobacterales bacterium]